MTLRGIDHLQHNMLAATATAHVAVGGVGAGSTAALAQPVTAALLATAVRCMMMMLVAVVEGSKAGQQKASSSSGDGHLVVGLLL
jgi:hypothetical protein